MFLLTLHTADSDWQRMCEHARAVDARILFAFFIFLTRKWTRLDLRKVHIQFKASCLKSSVCFGRKPLVNKCWNFSYLHSEWTLTVLKKLCGDGLSLEFLKMEIYIHFYAPFLHMYVSVRGRNSTCGITLFIAKYAVLRMGEHSSILFCPPLEASLEDWKYDMPNETYFSNKPWPYIVHQ